MKYMQYFSLSFIILFVFNLHAQNFEYQIKLKSVTFSGDGMYLLRKDNGSGLIPSNVHWSDDSTTNPSAFASGTFLKATASFEFICSNAPSTVFIRGFGPDSIFFTATELAVNGGSIEYPITPANVPFEFHKVRYYEEFPIDWQMSFDNTHWYPAGSSSSPVYITWETAIPEAPNPWDSYKYFLSLVHLSCKNADGAMTMNQVIDMIWQDFTDHSVSNVAGEPLHYYKDILCQYIDIPSLLKYKDGSCFSWAQLFLGTLKIHGFKQNNNYLNIDPAFLNTNCGVIDGFLAKTWTFNSANGICTDLPYVNVWDNPSETDTSYLFQYEDVHDELGVTGQTALNPASWFFSHQVAVVNNKFYDASYGMLYETLDDLKVGAFSGWWRFESAPESVIGIDVNGDGDLDTSPWYNYIMMSPEMNLTSLDTYYESW